MQRLHFPRGEHIDVKSWRWIVDTIPCLDALCLSFCCNPNFRMNTFCRAQLANAALAHGLQVCWGSSTGRFTVLIANASAMAGQWFVVFGRGWFGWSQRCNGWGHESIFTDPQTVYPQRLRWWCSGIICRLCRALVRHSLHVSAMTIIGETNRWKPNSWAASDSNPSQPNQSQATARKQARREMDEPNSADPQDTSKRNVISLKITGGEMDA